MVFEKIYEIFVSAFFIVIIAGMASFAQLKGMVYVNLKNFKVIKIKKFKFMFKSMYGGDLEKDGVIMSSFVYQIFSPILAILCCLIIIVLDLLGIDFTLRFLILFCALGADALYLIVLNLALYIVNKCRDKKNFYKDGCVDKLILQRAALYTKLARAKKCAKRYTAIEKKIQLNYEKEAIMQEEKQNIKHK